MKKLVAAASLAALLCMSWTSTAVAQAPPGGVSSPGAGAPAAPGHTGRDKGLMLRVGIGIDGCTDDFCDNNIDPSVSVRLVAAYKLMKYFAAGVHMAFLFGDPDNGIADHAWNLFLGVEGRGIFPYKQIDLWVALSLGWNRTMLGGDQFIPGAGVVDGRFWMNAFALGFGFGGDYFINKNIAVGLTFYLYKPWPQRGCFDSEITGDDCDDLTADFKDDVGIIWSINAMFTYFLPM